MAIYRGPGGAGDATNDAASEVLLATEARDQANASAIAAAESEVNAEAAATRAANSATSAASSASSASSSSSNASTSASQASIYAANAATSATNLSTAVSQASTSAGLASGYAANAAGSAADAAAVAANIAGDVNAAAGSASAAATSASAAAGSASNAATSASNAATSATNAANSASAASTSATNASNSASNASGSASAASTSATNASNSASAASTSASNASSSATNSATSATLANDWATKTTGTVAGGEYSAKYHAQQASSSASAASTSATNASNSASSASSSAASAAASYDAFDDRYLGSKASNPTVDNDGNALLTGALYYNTGANEMRVYNGSSWVAAYASLAGTLLTANNLSDLANASTARTNIGLGNVTNESKTTMFTAPTFTGNARTTGNLQVDGDLTVSGTTVTVNATNLAIEDNMIYLNNGSAVANPDLGIAGNYNDGTYRHAGVFRDATDGKWKFFKNYTPEPDASAYIDTTHASFALADIQANNFAGTLTGNVTGDVTGNVSGNAGTVTNGVYTTGSYSNPSWITGLAETKVLPLQTGNSGKVLKTNGTATSWGTLTTADVSEVTNLYYTDARVRAAISVSGSLSYNSTTGVISYTTPSTSGITEGTNLYYTDARARAALSASTGISYNSTTGAISSTITQYTDALAKAALSFTAGSGGYNSTTGVITIPTNTSQLTNGAGFITSAVTAVTGTAPIVSSGGNTPAISIPAATSTVNGYMTSTYAAKLDGIAAGATNVTNTNQLTNGAGFLTTAVTSLAGSSGITASASTGSVTVSPTSGYNGYGARTVSTLAPSGGSDGDIWYKV